ncbi:hypothetical protein QE152_g9989 [Popillia japonica]|uniref:Uncharacterized protein n=1 Tax=Popillia japonica TaxID=7064 RepID=A0AAW1LY14_POPJA
MNRAIISYVTVNLKQGIVSSQLRPPRRTNKASSPIRTSTNGAELLPNAILYNRTAIVRCKRGVMRHRTFIRIQDCELRRTLRCSEATAAATLPICNLQRNSVRITLLGARELS